MTDIVPFDGFPVVQDIIPIDMFLICQEVVTNTVIIFGACAVAFGILQILNVMLKVSSFKFFAKYESKLWVKK